MHCISFKNSQLNINMTIQVFKSKHGIGYIYLTIVSFKRTHNGNDYIYLTISLFKRTHHGEGCINVIIEKNILW